MDSPTTASSKTPYQIAYNASGSHAAEGSFMYYYSGYYYLFWSAGTCCSYDTNKPAAGDEYAIKVCRSTSATGNFVDQTGTSCTAGGGTTLLSSHDYVYGPGGQGIFDDPTHGTVIYYHYGEWFLFFQESKRRRTDFANFLNQRILTLVSRIASINLAGTYLAGRVDGRPFKGDRVFNS